MLFLIKDVIPINVGVLTFIIGIIIFCIFFILSGFFLGEKKCIKSKEIPFEGGIDSFGSVKSFIPIKFYLIAIFFVIFDIEAAYIYVWVIQIRKLGWIVFIEMSIFCIILIINLFYLFRIGALDWSNKKKD